MKISNIMQTNIISISENTSIKEGARLIFSLGIGAIPVVKNKKLVGILTGHDILSKMYPTMQELIDDSVHTHDFEQMEENLKYLLDTPVEKIMNQAVTTIKPQTPIMQAQSLMLIHHFSHLPVVNEKQDLLGIVSQGDIFRQLIKNEIPKLEKERYAGFIANYYDLMVNWEKRLNFEFPVFLELFKKEKVKNILDLGVWTGEYTIRLAKKGTYKILGLDHNPIMIELCEKKKEKLPLPIKQRVSFMLSNFTCLSDKIISNKFDAAICIGSSLPYIPISLDKLFKEVASVLKTNGLLIIQTLNFEKILNTSSKLLTFITQKSHQNHNKEHLLIEFFDKKKKRKSFIHNIIIFDSDGKNWLFRGITAILVHQIKKNDLERALIKAGFADISFSGNKGKYHDYGELSFSKPFNVKEDDFLNILAKKKI